MRIIIIMREMKRRSKRCLSDSSPSVRLFLPKSAPAHIEATLCYNNRTIKGQDINLLFVSSVHFIPIRHADMSFNKFNSDRK